MSGKLPVLPLCAFLLLLPAGCEKRDDKFTLTNIVKASIMVVKDKGVTELSAEAVNEEIEKMYSSDDDLLQKKSYLRNRDSDGSNNYRIIMDDTIEDERYKKSREKKDPFKR